MLIAANLPDVDIAVAAWGDLAYLAHHRGITHSFLGLAVEAPLLAGAMLLWDRGFRRRRRTELAPARFWRLTLVAIVGLGSHLLLDYTNSYGVKPWLPFDASWYYGDLVFIVDPWLWLALGGALFVGSRRRRWITLSWTALFAVMALAVTATGFLARATPSGFVPAALWLVGLAAVFVAWRRSGDATPARLARGAIAVVFAYWALLGVAHHFAVEKIGGRPGDNVAALPTLMRPDRWDAFVLTGAEVRTGTVRLGRDAPSFASSPRMLADPAVQAALATCPGSIALAFNRFLYAEVQTKPDGGTRVLLRDARFGSVPARVSFATTEVDLDGGLRPVPDHERDCPRLGSSW